MAKREPLRETTDVRVVVGEAAPPAEAEGSLRSILESEGFEILGEASDPDQLQQLLLETDPQVVVFDAGTAATTILAVRDWAPQAGIVVVWPADVAAAGADQQVEPAKAASDLGDAVRRALRTHRAPEEPIVVPETPLTSEVPEATASEREPAEAPPVGGEPPAARKGLRRADLALALAALALVLVVLLAFVLLPGDKQDSGAVSPGPNPSPSPSASATVPSPLAAPQDLSASKVGASTVTLTWAPGAGLTPTAFAIVRDKTEVARTGPGVTRWKDSGLAPGTSYTYVVRAIVGKTAISSAPVTIKTRVPPVSDAALVGTWRVTYTVTSSSLGDAAVGQVASYEWVFTSACDAQKPCGGTWTVHLPNGLDPSGTLRAAGGHFLGSMRDQPLGSCGGSEILASVTSVIRPLKAAMFDGRWTVRSFDGTFSESFPAQNGCPASGLAATISGVRTS